MMTRVEPQTKITELNPPHQFLFTNPYDPITISFDRPVVIGIGDFIIQQRARDGSYDPNGETLRIPSSDSAKVYVVDRILTIDPAANNPGGFAFPGSLLMSLPLPYGSRGSCAFERMSEHPLILLSSFYLCDSFDFL